MSGVARYRFRAAASLPAERQREWPGSAASGFPGPSAGAAAFPSLCFSSFFPSGLKPRLPRKLLRSLAQRNERSEALFLRALRGQRPLDKATSSLRPAAGGRRSGPLGASTFWAQRLRCRADISVLTRLWTSVNLKHSFYSALYMYSEQQQFVIYVDILWISKYIFYPVFLKIYRTDLRSC